MSESKSIDEKKLNSFMDKIFNDLSGSYTTLLCIIGDRLDLFKKLEHISIYRISVIRCVKNCTCSGTFTQ